MILICSVLDTALFATIQREQSTQLAPVIIGRGSDRLVVGYAVVQLEA